MLARRSKGGPKRDGRIRPGPGRAQRASDGNAPGDLVSRDPRAPCLSDWSHHAVPSCGPPSPRSAPAWADSAASRRPRVETDRGCSSISLRRRRVVRRTRVESPLTCVPSGRARECSAAFRWRRAGLGNVVTMVGVEKKRQGGGGSAFGCPWWSNVPWNRRRYSDSSHRAACGRVLGYGLVAAWPSRSHPGRRRAAAVATVHGVEAAPPCPPTASHRPTSTARRCRTWA